MSKVCRYAVPFLQCIPMWETEKSKLLKEKLEKEGFDSESSGDCPLDPYEEQKSEQVGPSDIQSELGLLAKVGKKKTRIMAIDNLCQAGDQPSTIEERLENVKRIKLQKQQQVNLQPLSSTFTKGTTLFKPQSGQEFEPHSQLIEEPEEPEEQIFIAPKKVQKVQNEPVQRGTYQNYEDLRQSKESIDKPCKFGDKCKFFQQGYCIFNHDGQQRAKSIQHDKIGTKPCKFGNDCKFFQQGKCVFKHDGAEHVQQESGQRMCKFGASCKHLEWGTCKFKHEEKEENDGGDRIAQKPHMKPRKAKSMPKVFGKAINYFDSGAQSEAEQVQEPEQVQPIRMQPQAQIVVQDIQVQPQAPARKIMSIPKPKQIVYEPIPDSVKQFFFQAQDCPDFLNDYDAIGFDVDNCLVKYNFKVMIDCITTDIFTELYKTFKYPYQVLDFDFGQNLGVYLNNAVWDIQHGTILKICEGRFISHAIKGFQKLSDAQIREIYGEPPVFDSLKWPRINKHLKTNQEAHWVLYGQFEACMVPVICHVTHLINNGTIKNTTLLNFSKDLQKIAYRQFDPPRLSFDQNSAENSQMFLKHVFKQPQKFIKKQPELAIILNTLRAKGIKLFLATNGHLLYTEMVMTETLGRKWRDLFEVCLVDCHKPEFQREDRPFYEVNLRQADRKGYRVSNGEMMRKVCARSHKVFLEGNIKTLTEFLQVTCQKKDIRVAYLGDQMLSDIQATGEYNQTLVERKVEARWDTIAVIDELSQEDPKCLTSVPQNSKLWGASFFLDKNIGKTHYLDQTSNSRIPKLRKSQISMIKRNFFVAEVSRIARYILPEVRYMIDPKKLNPNRIQRSFGTKQVLTSLHNRKTLTSNFQAFQASDIKSFLSQQDIE